MDKFNINTDKLRIEGENLVNISSNYSKVMDNVFEKINNLKTNEIWIDDGEGSATAFIEGVNDNKAQMYDVGNNIKKIGEELISFSDKMRVNSERVL